jgi:hypothetical protein
MKRRVSQALGGALIFAIVGGAWSAYGVYALGRSDLPWLMFAPIVIALILLTLVARLQRRVDARDAEPWTPSELEQGKKDGRMFAAVNIVQGIAIFIAVQVWYNLQRPEYLAPTIGIIVGLHFLALARLMRMPAHFIPGALMILLAVVVMVAVPSRQYWGVAVGFGNALILWGCYGLRLREAYALV